MYIYCLSIDSYIFLDMFLHLNIIVNRYVYVPARRYILDEYHCKLTLLILLPLQLSGMYRSCLQLVRANKR